MSEVKEWWTYASHLFDFEPMAYESIVHVVEKKHLDAANERIKKLEEALRKIAFEDENNSNFNFAHQEAQYYIDTARDALK